jgi:hypothetical protein
MRILLLGIGDWGLGIGDWGLGIGRLVSSGQPPQRPASGNQLNNRQSAIANNQIGNLQ